MFSQIHVLMYDQISYVIVSQNSCFYVLSEFMCKCMIIIHVFIDYQIHVLMCDQNSCVYVLSEFMCLCIIRIHV
jgi:hypothetical protein